MMVEVFGLDSSSGDIARPALIILSLHRLLSSDLETSKANFNTIIQVDGEYAWNTAKALSILKERGFPTDGQEGLANRVAITQGGGQYAKNIAQAVVMLGRGVLLRGDQGQANLAAIMNNVQHGGNIVHALVRLNKYFLLTDDQAQANFDAIMQDGGRYALDIARALLILDQSYSYTIREEIGQTGAYRFRRYSLLSGDQGQANRDAIVRARSHVGDIASVLLKLKKMNLLLGDQAQANFNLLMNYVYQADQKHHGISFLAKKIYSIQSLTQKHYNIAVLNSDHLDPESCAIFSQIFSLPEIVLSEGFDPVYLLKDMLEFCEYVATYLGDGDFIAQWISDILNHTQTGFGVVNKMFFDLFRNNNNREQKQEIMLAIIEMLRKNDEPEATFSTAILGKIKQVYLDNFTLTSAIEFISHEEKKLPENEKLTQEDDMKNNEAIVVLLSFILDRNLECFMTLSHSLCEHMEQRKQPATLTPSSSSFFSKKEGSVVSPMSIKPNF